MTQDARPIASEPGLARARAEAVRELAGVRRMWLSAASDEKLSFEGFRPARAGLVLTPVVFVLALVPWLHPSPLTWERLLTAGALFAALLTLIATCRPRRHRVEVLPRESRVVSASGSYPLAEARWVLDMAEDPLDPRGFYYAARLTSGTSEGWQLIRSSEPERVLVALRRVLRVWALPVVSGWGLPEQVRPWEFKPGRGLRRDGAPPDSEPLSSTAERSGVPRSSVPKLVIAAPRFGVASGLAGALLLITVVLGAEIVFLVRSGGLGLPRLHPLSLILPSVLALILACLTAWVGSRHSRFVVGRDVVLETATWISTRCRGRVPAAAVRGVHVVGFEGSLLRHVLLESDEGPLSLLVRSNDAAELASRLRHAIAGRAPSASGVHASHAALVTETWD